MFRFKPICAALTLMAVGIYFLGCGEGPRPPAPDDPAFGLAGNVLISDRNRSTDGNNDEIWIGFNSGSAWQTFLALRDAHSGGGFWIGGRVVVSSKHKFGFYFDPASTAVFGVSTENNTTVLDAIKAEPSKYANDPGIKVWLIPAVIEK
jgi:hypothetical protein